MWLLLAAHYAISSVFALSLILDRSQFLETLSSLVVMDANVRTATPTPSIDDDRYPQQPSLPPRTLTEIVHDYRQCIHEIVAADPQLAGPVVRLAFHDAVTRDNNNGGANGSIRYELSRSENRGLGKPLELVQGLRQDIPLSLADAIALAGAQAIETAGGPAIGIRLGRPDVETADAEYLVHPLQAQTSRSLVTKTLPSAGLDSDGLRLYFHARGFSDPEWIALTGGAHGLGRHVSLLGMSKPCLRNLTRSCLEEAPVLLPFVTASVDSLAHPQVFFQALLDWNSNHVKLGQVAFLPTDVAMVVDLGLQRHVQRFARDPRYFRRVFKRAYQRLVDGTAITRQRF